MCYEMIWEEINKHNEELIKKIDIANVRLDREIGELRNQFQCQLSNFNKDIERLEKRFVKLNTERALQPTDSVVRNDLRILEFGGKSSGERFAHSSNYSLWLEDRTRFTAALRGEATQVVKRVHRGSRLD